MQSNNNKKLKGIDKRELQKDICKFTKSKLYNLWYKSITENGGKSIGEREQEKKNW
jgi:hypothetical protein